jgi:hypothetical protein
MAGGAGLLRLVAAALLLPAAAAQCNASYVAVDTQCPEGLVASPTRGVCYGAAHWIVGGKPMISAWTTSANPRCQNLAAAHDMVGQLATARSVYEWQAMERACGADREYRDFWTGLVEEPGGGTAEHRWNWTDGWRTQPAVSDRVVHALRSRPDWSFAACDCAWDAGYPKPYSGSPTCVLARNTACAAEPCNATAPPSSDARNGGYFLRNEPCGTLLGSACCELKYAGDTNLPVYRGLNTPPRVLLPSWPGDGALDLRVADVTPEGTVLAVVPVEDDDHKGSPAGSVYLRVSDSRFVYADPNRHVLVYRGTPPSLRDGALRQGGVVEVVTVWAEDGMGCNSSERLSVRVAVLPSYPLEWAPLDDPSFPECSGGLCFGRGATPESLTAVSAANGTLTSASCAGLHPAARLVTSPRAYYGFSGGGEVAFNTYVDVLTTSAIMRGCFPATADAADDDDAAASTSPAWTSAYLQSDGDTLSSPQGCAWRFGDDGRSLPLCEPWLRPVSDNLTHPDVGKRCMSLEPGPASRDQPVFRAEACDAQFPPCCEVDRAATRWAPNSPPYFVAARQHIVITFYSEGEGIKHTFEVHVYDGDILTAGGGHNSAAEVTLELINATGPVDELIRPGWISTSFPYATTSLFRLKLIINGAHMSDVIHATQDPTRSVEIELTFRACDGLGACTDSQQAASAPAGLVKPDLHLTILVLVCRPPCAADEVEVVPCERRAYLSFDEAEQAHANRQHNFFFRYQTNRVCVPRGVAAFGDGAAWLYAPLFTTGGGTDVVVSSLVVAVTVSWAVACVGAAAYACLASATQQLTTPDACDAAADGVKSDGSSVAAMSAGAGPPLGVVGSAVGLFGARPVAPSASSPAARVRRLRAATYAAVRVVAQWCGTPAPAWSRARRAHPGTPHNGHATRSPTSAPPTPSCARATSGALPELDLARAHRPTAPRTRPPPAPHPPPPRRWPPPSSSSCRRCPRSTARCWAA